MQEQDKKSFKDMMMAAGEVYGREVTKPLLQMYFVALSHISIEQAQNAMMAHMQNTESGQFFPKPADLLRQITGTAKQQDSDIELRARIAWASVTDQIRRKGSYGSLRLDDRLALAAVKNMGSWQDLCMTPTDKMNWKEKEFIELYKSFERAPIEMLPDHLPGRIEIEHHKKNAVGGMKALSDGVQKWRESNAPKLEVK